MKAVARTVPGQSSQAAGKRARALGMRIRACRDACLGDDWPRAGLRQPTEGRRIPAAKEEFLSRSLALITGANRGIGRAIAVHLARSGFDCIGGDLAHTADTVETKRLVLARRGVPLCRAV